MILVDTGVWLALADRGNAYHARCREFFQRNREPLMTTYPVLVECVHLMFSRIGVSRTLDLITALRHRAAFRYNLPWPSLKIHWRQSSAGHRIET